MMMMIIIITNLTANGLSPGGSGYNACTWIWNKDLRNLSREGYMRSISAPTKFSQLRILLTWPRPLQGLELQNCSPRELIFWSILILTRHFCGVTEENKIPLCEYPDSETSFRDFPNTTQDCYMLDRTRGVSDVIQSMRIGLVTRNERHR